MNERTKGAVGGAASGAQIGTQIMPGYGTVIGAIVGGAIGYFTSKEAKKAPPPPSYYEYDDQGRLLGAMEWNGNGYSYRKGYVSAEEYNRFEALGKARNAVLGDISETPADRLAAYEKYAKDWSDKLHGLSDPEYLRDVQSRTEDLNARGLGGSRAYVDTMAEMERLKGISDREIARDASLQAEALKQRDYQNNLNLAQYYDNVFARREEVDSARANRLMSGTSLAMQGQTNQFKMDEALLKQTKEDNQQVQDTLGGLAYMYGLSGKSGTGGGTKTTTTDGLSGGGLTGKYTFGQQYKF